MKEMEMWVNGGTNEWTSSEQKIYMYYILYICIICIINTFPLFVIFVTVATTIYALTMLNEFIMRKKMRVPVLSAIKHGSFSLFHVPNGFAY